MQEFTVTSIIAVTTISMEEEPFTMVQCFWRPIIHCLVDRVCSAKPSCKGSFLLSYVLRASENIIAYGRKCHPEIEKKVTAELKVPLATMDCTLLICLL